LDTVSKIRRNEILKRYQAVLNPEKLKVVLVGNWTDKAEALLLSSLSDLELDAVSEVKLNRVAVPEKIKSNILFHKKDLKQANVKFGISAIPRSSKDYEALKVGLFVLGGSFKSRLNKELRIKRGLTYGVGASVDARFDGGLITISGAVRHEKLFEFIVQAKKIMSRVALEGITKAELEKAKAIIRGQFPRGVETKDKEASLYLDLVSRGVEGEELYRYLNKVMNLTLNDVNEALRKHLSMENLNTVVLANKYNITRKDLKRLRFKSKSYSKIQL
jgi:zinc protease